MSLTNINPYPAAAAAIDKQVVENIFLDDIINHDYSRGTKMALLVCMKNLRNRIEDDEDYWAEVTGDEEWEKAQREARQKLARKLMDEFKAKRARQKEEEDEDEMGEEQEEEDDDDDDDDEEEEDEESEEEEEDFEEEYDDEEEETEGSEESEESGDEESDDGSDWDSLFLLVHNMPTENDEPKSTARKRSLPRDDTPCPPPRPQPVKRQKLDPSAASKAPMVQDSGEEEPKPVTRKRRLIAQQDADTPATEVPFPKRQRLDSSAVMANANDEDREQEQAQTQTQEAKSSVPSEWLAPHREELENSQLPETLRGILGRLPVNELHYEAQAFLLSLKYFDPTDDALAKAAIDMGLRFSKTAKSSEYKIVFEYMMKHPIQAVMYNVCKEDEAQHILFWEKVRNVTGKEIPPERIKERRQKRAKREAEAMARFNARKAAEEAKRESQMLKEKYVSQIGEASKLPLKEKVGRWLAEIVKAEKKQ